MDFVFALDKIRTGSRVTRPSLYPSFLMLALDGPAQILLVEGDGRVHHTWIPGQEDLLAVDWYLSKPPTQRAAPAGFVDSVVKGL